MSESLSSLSKSFREALLRRNLSIGDINVPNFGLTREIGEYNPASEDSQSSLYISNANSVKSSLAYNRYSYGEQMDTYVSNQEIVRYNGSETYLDKWDIGSEETGKIKAFNAIGSILNGTGLGFNGSGIEDTFDIRSTLAGRILSATGVINDTPLGINSGQELLKHMTNRVMFNTQKQTLGRIDIDPINAIKGGSLLRPDYSITTGHNNSTKALEVLEDLTGFNLPFSQLSPDASINKPGYSQALIKNTGKGQVRELFFNLEKNRFGPNYSDERIEKITLEDKRTYDDATQGFLGVASGTESYENLHPDKDSLLFKTKELLGDKNKFKLIDGKQMIVTPHFSQNPTKLGMMNFLSKGSGVLNSNALRGVPDEDGNIFGRVHTKDDPYNSIKKLQKNKGLAYTNSAEDSVLDSNGFIRVSPNKNDIMEGKEANIKNFMFSIENLAWHGSKEYGDLAPSEVGPGDLVTGTKGRIMWFPPYDISFSEVTSVNWETTQFIGRGEPIYTYNNTERVGSLDFKVIMDYPSYMDDLKSLNSDELFRAIAAGVEDIDYTQFKNLAPNEVKDLQVGTLVKPKTIYDTAQTEPEDFEVYFDKDVTNPLFVYEPNGLNSHFTSDFIPNLQKQLTEDCPACKLTIKGYGSMDETVEVAQARADRFKTYLSSNGLAANKISVSPDAQLVGCGGEAHMYSDCRKKARKVLVVSEYNPADNEENMLNVPPTIPQNRDLSQKLKKRFINEALYFEKLSEENPLVYESISESIKHFHPAFHSVTPEGFNSRLNFLQQCTRQGPTKGQDKASNLAFGKPPVCILRLGDFYHTKIVIDSVSLTFEEHQWDLNPEGAGVQPMIAKVQLSFKFIGGSSLKGPINKLQNAVAFNFFANSEIYDDRAERIVKVGEKHMYSSDYEAEQRKVEKVNDLKSGGIIVSEPEVEQIKRIERPTPPVEENTAEELFKNLNYSYYFETYNPPEGENERMSFTFTKKDVNIVMKEGQSMIIKLKVQYRPTGDMIPLDNFVLTEADFGKEIWRTYPQRLDFPYDITQWNPDTQGPVMFMTFSYEGMSTVFEFPTNPFA